MVIKKKDIYLFVRPIERALLSYGFSKISLEILEYCDKNDVLSYPLH